NVLFKNATNAPTNNTAIIKYGGFLNVFTSCVCSIILFPFFNLSIFLFLYSNYFILAVQKIQHFYTHSLKTLRIHALNSRMRVQFRVYSTKKFTIITLYAKEIVLIDMEEVHESTKKTGTY